MSHSASTYSLVIPIYKSRETLPALMAVLETLNCQLAGSLQVVFVIDDSPDDSLAFLLTALPEQKFSSSLLTLSRNFGAFQAMRVGLEEARGEYLAVMAADLQEPPELVLSMFQTLAEEPVDLVIGVRMSRQDPWLSQLFSKLFWGCYRRYVQKDMPPGGMDIFGCNRRFRDHLVGLREANGSLVGQALWLGFRRKHLPYHRQARPAGRSAWCAAKKLRYLMDSVFSLTDLPVFLLLVLGKLGILLALLLAVLTMFARLSGLIEVPGYAMTITTICLFSGINLLGLGIIGIYAWRAYENTKARPLGIVSYSEEFQGHAFDSRLPASAKSL